MIDSTALGIALGLTLIARFIRNIKARKNGVDKQPTRQIIDVELTNEVDIEKVRNLYEEQDAYNMQIEHLMRENDILQSDIDELNDKINANKCMGSVIEAQMSEGSNKDIARQILVIERTILNNMEKIAKLKQKSNDISTKVEAIGMQAWKRQQM